MKNTAFKAHNQLQLTLIKLHETKARNPFEAKKQEKSIDIENFLGIILLVALFIFCFVIFPISVN